MQFYLNGLLKLRQEFNYWVELIQLKCLAKIESILIVNNRAFFKDSLDKSIEFTSVMLQFSHGMTPLIVGMKDI